MSDQSEIERLRKRISFLHSGLPDCTSPIVTHVDGCPEFPFIHGTGFFARKRDRIVFITARHCLSKEPTDNLSGVANRLHVPYTLDGFKGSREDYVVFDSIYSFRHKSPDIPGEFVDFVMLMVDVKPGTWQERHLRARAAKLPPTGDWLDRFSRASLVQQAFLQGGNIRLAAVGYPWDGTSTEVSLERGITTQNAVMSGVLRAGVYPHTMSMVDMTWRHDLNGFSGAPVFLAFRDVHGHQYALAGMLVVGGNQQGQFIRISQITGSHFDPPLDFDIRD